MLNSSAASTQRGACNASCPPFKRGDTQQIFLRLPQFTTTCGFSRQEHRALVGLPDRGRRVVGLTKVGDNQRCEVLRCLMFLNLVASHVL